MGKGIVKDADPHSVGSARTFVLKNADVIFLCCARLNWILHFGAPPRFNKDVKIIQLDSDPHEIHTNLQSTIPLVGDAKTLLGQMATAVTKPLHDNDSAWWRDIRAKCDANQKVSDKLYADRTIPMNYYSSLKIVEDAIQKQKSDYILVSEGSNTMDIGRTILTNTEAKQRLDAGTFGTMGVSLGFGIAAQSLYPARKVVLVVGDSAFGFSGMEVETAARYGLPLKIVIINNSGITRGVDEITEQDKRDNTGIPVTALTPKAEYELVSKAFGGEGTSVSDHKSLQEVMDKMLSDNKLWIVNVHIDPYAGRKEQEFSWLTREDAPAATAKKPSEDAKAKL